VFAAAQVFNPEAMRMERAAEKLAAVAVAQPSIRPLGRRCAVSCPSGDASRTWLERLSMSPQAERSRSRTDDPRNPGVS
jgi:hypothetical protein